MKGFKDWSIRNKLILPLYAVVALGSGGIIYALEKMHDEITNDVLPEERALDGIRRSSLELLSEYRKFMLVQSASTQAEIDRLKENIERYEADFASAARSDIPDLWFIETIDASEQEMERVGDEAMILRVRLLGHVEEMESFEATVEHLPAGGPGGAELANDRQVPGLKELVEKYISEIREYALVPSDMTLEEIEKIERSLGEMLRVGDDDPASEPGNLEKDAAKRKLIKSLLASGSIIITSTNDFLTALDVLEEKEDNLLEVLDAVGSLLAQETDYAFEIGFASVAGLIFGVLVMMSLVAYAVTYQIGKSVTALTYAAHRLGGGDLNARADIGGEDEIGDLATAFNEMAQRLQETTVSRIELSLEVTERKQAEEKISKSLAEKEILLREIHHRVKNNMQVISSMLSLQASTETDSRSAKVLEDSQRRIRVMARLHENLHQSDDLNFINTREYLHTVVEDTMASSKLDKQIISSHLEVDDIVFDVDDAIACGQIVSEAFSNALKHAFPNGQPGSIKVSLHRRDGEKIELSIADNGMGLPEQFDSRQSKTLGMRLIHALASQLNGVANVDGSGGTHVKVTFPERRS